MNKLMTDKTSPCVADVIAAVSKHYGISPEKVGELPAEVVMSMFQNMTR